MIQKLRLKFICINMSIVTIMLCVIMGLLLHFTGMNLEKESISMLRSVAIDPLQLGIPGEYAAGTRLPYFSLQLGLHGELVTFSSGNFDLSDQDMLDSLIALSASQKTGTLPEYGLRYMRLVTPAGQHILFADMTSEINTMNSLRRSCLIIGAVSFLVFLLISILLARWAVKPVEDAWKQQRQFVADASHELKTPLTVILSNAQMLSAHQSDPQLCGRLTANIVTVSNQMRDLIDKLLHSAQVDQGLEAISFSAVELSEAVSDALLTFEPVFYEQELTLDSTLQSPLVVWGSRPHLQQIVDILLDNAQKYSCQHGHTQVVLRRLGKKRCLLSVANEGAPLSLQEQRTIFKRFYRADSARPRTGSYGLGLSIAEDLVKLHRGTIWVESQHGINTFFVQLPLAGKVPPKPRRCAATFS